MILASYTDVCRDGSGPGSRILREYYCSTNPSGDPIIDNAYINCMTYGAKWGCVNDRCNIPEFTAIGMGIALAGASAGYALIRRKRK